jgi:hypothetical protein
MLIGGGMNVLGGLFGGDGGQKKLAKEQFNMSNAPAIARMLESAPLRTKLLQIMGGLTDQAPQPFVPRDLFNPQGTSLPGIPGSQPVAQGGARAQLGGFDPSAFLRPSGEGTDARNQLLYRTILGQMGYGNLYNPKPQDAPAPMTPNGDPRQTGGGASSGSPWGFAVRDQPLTRGR